MSDDRVNVILITLVSVVAVGAWVLWCCNGVSR